MANERGAITRWSRGAAVLALAAVIAPAGTYRWTALALAGVALVMAAKRVPRHAWSAHWLLLSLLACAVGAIWVVELFGIDGPAAVWTVTLAGVAFVAAVLIGAVRIFRQPARVLSATHTKDDA